MLYLRQSIEKTSKVWFKLLPS